MSASTSFLRLPLTLSSLAVVVTLVAVGCGGKADEPTTNASETNASEGAQTSGGPGSSSASPECAKRACGVDCTPAGSDEPFNCNSLGKCVATGVALGCAPKTCAEFLGDCIASEEPAFDGDGCRIGCKPKACPPFVADCRQGDEPADLDGDGCTDGCRPIGSK